MIWRLRNDKQASMRHPEQGNRRLDGLIPQIQNAIKKMKRREAMDDGSWAKDVMRRRVNTAVNIEEVQAEKERCICTTVC